MTPEQLLSYTDAELVAARARLDFQLTQKPHRPAHLTQQLGNVLDEIRRRRVSTKELAGYWQFGENIPLTFEPTYGEIGTSD